MSAQLKKSSQFEIKMQTLDERRSIICDRIRFWHKQNLKDIFEFGWLERLDLEILEKILESEHKISLKICRG
jgi:hypothetical protein